MNGYPLFHQLCKDEFKKRYPEEAVPVELSKKCVDRWKTMSDREKRWFNHAAEQEKKRTMLENSPNTDNKKNPRNLFRIFKHTKVALFNYFIAPFITKKLQSKFIN